ncbi:transcriptional regulator [Bacillus cereus]|nr:helix-turn-helix transcriptional regulator [Bacillus paramycoides]PFI81976.1 transcriptional regulator [Bacillus thuringiensis]PFO50789.1 transcriptional regulator [Bacillus cereus]PGL03269.1 transcriptional regulator [Bacillus cereus]PGT24868.1 transcriptional regulator [Bacillus thuringiensis]
MEGANNKWGDFMNKRELQVDLDIDKMPIHRQLRWKRLSQGLTQDDMIQWLGFGKNNRSMISRIENGKIKIPEQYMDKVLEYLYGERKGDE